MLVCHLLTLIHQKDMTGKHGILHKALHLEGSNLCHFCGGNKLQQHPLQGMYIG